MTTIIDPGTDAHNEIVALLDSDDDTLTPAQRGARTRAANKAAREESTQRAALKAEEQKLLHDGLEFIGALEKEMWADANADGMCGVADTWLVAHGLHSRPREQSFYVPVTVTYSGIVSVSAYDPEDAVNRFGRQTIGQIAAANRNLRDYGHVHSVTVDGPAVDSDHVVYDPQRGQDTRTLEQFQRQSS